ncbi:MAG TPA: hypothetical protein VKV32_05205 [Stellaceae bacterium]|nr:hypothetical protein [Stellaceae bacterium]
MNLSGKLFALGVAAAAFGFIQTGSAQAAGPTMVIQSDMVEGFIQGMKTPPCVMSSQFHHKEEVVFRVRVIDTKTGKPMDNKALKSVTVELPDGQKFPVHYGKHPPQDPVAYYWTYGWVIPANYPSGSITYKVTAVDQHGHTATFTPFEAKESQLTILADAQ